MSNEYILPRDVPISDTYIDPNDDQRRWALGWSATARAFRFLTSWRDNPEWKVAQDCGAPTVARVAMWAKMLDETEEPQ